jgi:hypothetical protein
MAEFNRYYQHFLQQMDGGNIIVPNLGEIYRYKGALRGGGGHLLYARIRVQRGNGVGSYLTAVYHRAKPLLKVLGVKAVKVLSNIAKDTINGVDLKTAVVKNVVKVIPPKLAAFLPRKRRLVEKSPISPSDVIKSKKVRRLEPKQLTGRGLSVRYPGLQFLQ